MTELVRIDLKPILETIVGGAVEDSTQLDDRDTANRNTDNHVDGATNGVYTLTERSKVANVPDDTNQEIANINALLTSAVDTLDASIKLNADKLDEINGTTEW